MLAAWVVWWRGFGSMVLIGVVEWRGGDQCGGFLDWQDWRWWVSALWLLVRSTVSLCFFFFPLGDYVVVVSCGCGCCWWFLKSSLCLFFLCGGSFLRLWLVVGGWSELWVCSDW